jgi:cytochrome c oxidase assembly protein subunit 11
VSQPTRNPEQRRHRTLILASGLALAMFGFGFALVPLYGLLCEVTGTPSVQQRSTVGGAVQVVPAGRQAGVVDEGRWITVKFDATVHPDLPWTLEPEERSLRVHPGETRQVRFLATNRSSKEVTGQALPSFAPWQATDFFHKLECFCFRQQTLAGGEVKEMPLIFAVSPDLPADIGAITLSYSVMRVSPPDTLAGR